MEIKVATEPTDDYERQLGRIRKAELGWEDDRRVFGFNIDLELSGGSDQATGWIGLPPEDVPKFLSDLLRACGCSRWSALKGRLVVVRRELPDRFIRGFETLPLGEQFGMNFSDYWPS